MAVRDGERYLAEALDSILGQSVPADRGDRGRRRLGRRHPRGARRLRRRHPGASGSPPSGQATALNTGIAAATGTYLSFLDADDVWEPGAQQRRLERLHQPDAPDAVFGRIVQFVSPELGPEAVAQFRFDPAPAVAESPPGDGDPTRRVRSRAARSTPGSPARPTSTGCRGRGSCGLRFATHRRRRRPPASAPHQHGRHDGRQPAQGTHRRRADAPRAHATPRRQPRTQPP